MISQNEYGSRSLTNHKPNAGSGNDKGSAGCNFESMDGSLGVVCVCSLAADAGVSAEVVGTFLPGRAGS